MIIFSIFFLIAYLFWSIFSGKHEGDKIEKSLRFLFKNYYIHLHHWILSLIILLILLVMGFHNVIIIGLLTGSIIQGLTYKDRFVVIYHKDDFEHIYSKWNTKVE